MINCINCIGDKGVESIHTCLTALLWFQGVRLYNLVPECHVTLGAKKKSGDRGNSVLKKHNKVAIF